MQDDLRRAGIEPFAWVIEQSLLASGTTDPVLAERGRCERPWVQQVMATDARAARCWPCKRDRRWAGRRCATWPDAEAWETPGLSLPESP